MGCGAASRADRALGRRHVVEASLGLIQDLRTTAGEREPTLERPDRLRQVFLLASELLNGPLQFSQRCLIVHGRDVLVDRLLSMPLTRLLSLLSLHHAWWASGRWAASDAIRPRMPFTNLPESGPPNVFASSIDSLIAALIGTLGR